MFNHKLYQIKVQSFTGKVSLALLSLMLILILFLSNSSRVSLIMANSPITPPTTPPIQPISGVIPPPSCTIYGSSILDQKAGGTAIPVQLNTNWKSLKFTPKNNGLLDKISLYLSGSGTVRVKVIDSDGKEATEIITATVNNNGSWKTFNFANEPKVTATERFTVMFKAVSGNVYAHQGAGLVFARKIFIKPCVN